MKKETLETYALAGIGLVGGIYKYFVRDVIADMFDGWVESHMMSQEELDKHIGEVALEYNIVLDEPTGHAE